MNKEKESSTPLMRQYWEIKSAHTDKLLFFRMGDFYEMFFDDAVVAAPLLGIALTSRNKKAQDETPMCGFPHHSVAGPINKLLGLGYKVALCDQIEDPKLAKGLVKRAVTRILTPGMVFDNDTLDASSSHFMACMDSKHMAFVDSTTGESFYFKVAEDRLRRQLLEVLPVAELVVAPGFDLEWNQKLHPISLSVHSELMVEGREPEACSRLRSYIQSLGGPESLAVLKPFEMREWQQRLELTPTTLRHLEIFSTYKGESKGSLFRAIHRAQTSVGGRLLRQWLAFPLRDQKAIEQRLNRVEQWIQKSGELKEVRKQLAQIGDLERRLSRLVTPQSHPRDLLSLAQATLASLEALCLAQKFWPRKLSDEWLGILEQEAHKVLRTFREDAPLSTKQGHMIQGGVHAELDELIRLTQDSQSLLAELELREREATGIGSLKVRYNNVFGYYIEITHTHKEKIPAHYHRKQTLANAERYCTEELVELEKKVLTAQAKRAELEWAIYDGIRREIVQASQGYLSLSQEIAELDVITSLSWLALEQNYVRPQFHEALEQERPENHSPPSVRGMKLGGARHPVIEQERSLTFIPNNIHLEAGQCMLLTGPNMAGKSTLMRQVAVIAILAQIGSFVPCEKAELPLFDRIFTRIGASDHLTEGLSTFMVEMTETAEILKNCTGHSLIILDEVGRGTSTFDGLSLAQSILEHLLTQVRTTTFFATHYHELTELEGHYSNLLNFHMAVSEKGGEVRFLHTLVRGPALKSYGIYVAELAGVPGVVTRRAKSLLKQIEAQKVQVSAQLSFLDLEVESLAVPDPILEELRSLSLAELTPLKALNMVAEWQEKLQREHARQGSGFER